MTSPVSSIKSYDSVLINRLLLIAVLVCLIVLTYDVLRLFISPVLWAAIYAYVTWPLYRRLKALLRGNGWLSALLLTFLTAFIVFVPVAIGLNILQAEARELIDRLQSQLSSGQITLPSSVYNLPVVGSEIQTTVDNINAHPEDVVKSTQYWIQSHLSYGRQIFNQVSQNLAKLAISLMTLFFMYRDGESLFQQIRDAAVIIVGESADNYLRAIGQTTQAVVYGIGLTAVGQALVASIGYFISGAPNPILLTLITFIFALIPFGTPFVWGAVCLYMFGEGDLVGAFILLGWGIFVVSWVDNVIRPLVISGATKIPFILIMFGVLGGLAAFGLVGLFIGPVILAVMLGVWREWLTEHPNQEKVKAVDQYEVEHGEIPL